MGSRDKVAEFLSKSGIEFDLKEFEGSTKNSELAAEALGCSVAEIAKSVVFVGRTTAVVIISGDRRVDTRKLGGILGGEFRVAKPEEVRENTGFPIGGVPPFPHAEGVDVMPDVSLARFERVWAAGGTPNVVFRIRTADLVRLVGKGPFDLSA